MAVPLRLEEFLLSDVAALRGIIDAVPHPIFVKDDETRFVVVNEMMCKLMHKSFDELIGKQDHDFVNLRQRCQSAQRRPLAGFAFELLE